MTGPLDFLTTLSLGSSGGALAFSLAMAATGRPVRAATESARALRIMKARRSEPAGISQKFRSSAMAAGSKPRSIWVLQKWHARSGQAAHALSNAGNDKGFGGCRHRVKSGDDTGFPASIALLHEAVSLQGRRIVIFVALGSLGQFHLVMLDMLVRDEREDMGDAVQPRALLVVRAQDVPGRMPGVGGLEHHVARPRIFIPAFEGFQVHGA